VQCWDENQGTTLICTYADFVFNMLRAGSWLKLHGLQKENYCAILAHNSLPYLYVSFGAMSIGAVSMNLNWQQPSETNYLLLQKHNVQILCTSVHFDVHATAAGVPEPERQLPVHFQRLLLGDLEGHELTHSVKADLVKLQYSQQASAPAAIFFTSGTTGVPKAVPHTHMGLIWHAGKTEQLLCSHMNVSQGTLCFTPFFHVMGFVANCVFNLYVGVPVNIQAAPREQILSSELMLAACKHLKPSAVNTVPWIMEGIAEMLAAGNKSSQVVVQIPEIMTYGGAALPSACSDILRVAGAKIMCTYGQTELGGPVLFGEPGGHPNALIPWVKYNLKILDDAKDEGELVLIDNLSTTRGYLHASSQPQSLKLFETGDRFRRGGDIACKALFYVCRKDDLIKHVTGEFTNPLVTEHEIMNACVGTVNAVCMVGNCWPRPWLLVELCDGISKPDALRSIEAAVIKANAKQPKYSAVLHEHVMIVQTSSLPRTAKGTIRRAQAESMVPTAGTGAQDVHDSFDVLSTVREAFPGLEVFPSSKLSELGASSIHLVELARKLHVRPSELTQLDTIENITDHISRIPAADDVENNTTSEIDLDSLRPVILHPNCRFGWLTATCPLVVGDAEVHEAVASLLKLHPVLRVCFSQHGSIVYPWSAHDTVYSMESQEFRRTPEIYDVPLFRWTIEKKTAQVRFWIQHVISDGESVNIVQRDLTSLLQGQRLQPRPYQLLREVHMKFDELRGAPCVSLSPGRGPTWEGIWVVDGLAANSDVLAKTICAFLSASHAIGMNDKKLPVSVPITFDSRFWPELDSAASGLVSFMVVQKLCTFHSGAEGNLKAVRHVIDSTHEFSTTVFDDVINFTIHWDDEPPLKALPLAQLIFARTSSKPRNELQVQFFPKQGWLCLKINNLQAPLGWLHAFEHALNQMLLQPTSRAREHEYAQDVAHRHVRPRVSAAKLCTSIINCLPLKFPAKMALSICSK